MVRQVSVEVFRTPEERFEQLPGYDFTPHYVDIDGLRLHYVDFGPPTGKPVVCFHGNPSWAYLYRKMIGPLAGAGYRVVVPDYGGFGRSDKPTDRRWYTFDRHCELVAGLLGGLNLTDATVIVHDWGGPIGLRWTVSHADQVGALVILNTFLPTGRVSQEFLDWQRYAERTLDIPVGGVLQIATATELPDDVVAAYEAPFPTVESKAGVAQFPLLAPTDEDGPEVQEFRAVRDALSRWDKPTLVAFSDRDPGMRFPEAGQAFCDLIPTVTDQVVIEGASHFLHEDKGERIAQEVLNFLGQ
jgi:haloalkane dehalogenase